MSTMKTINDARKNLTSKRRIIDQTTYYSPSTFRVFKFKIEIPAIKINKYRSK